jgi:hypothetical protein
LRFSWWWRCQLWSSELRYCGNFLVGTVLEKHTTSIFRYPLPSLCTITTQKITKEPNTAVKWLALLLCIWEATGSNLGLKTASHDWDFHVFFSYCKQMLKKNINLGNSHFFPCPFRFINHHVWWYSLHYWQSY